jgi:hypothetical protein
VLQCELWDFSANILPSNFYNAKTISAVAKCQRSATKNLFVDAVAKGYFYGYVSLPKNFSASPAAIFALLIDIEKLIKAEGLILVKLPRERFRIKRVAALFRCLSFITEFVEVSFDAASGFSVLKNGLRRLSDFPGHFLGSGRVRQLVFAGFWGPGSSGRVVWGDKPKTRHFSGNLGCVGRQHP